jgi:hypothetical protein
MAYNQTMNGQTNGQEQKFTSERSEFNSFELYSQTEVGTQFMGRSFTENEINQLKSGQKIYWSGFDLGGDKKDIGLKMQRYTDDKGEIKTSLAFTAKADKLEIPDSILERQLNDDEKKQLKAGKTFVFEREDRKYHISIDQKLNTISVRTPQELGIKEELGGYKFSKRELERLGNGVNIGPRVYKSPKYGYFMADLEIKQKGDHFEYKYKDVVNLNRKEAIKLKDILNKDIQPYSEDIHHKVMDAMDDRPEGYEKAFEESVKKSNKEPEYKDVTKAKNGTDKSETVRYKKSATTKKGKDFPSVKVI